MAVEEEGGEQLARVVALALVPVRRYAVPAAVAYNCLFVFIFQKILCAVRMATLMPTDVP